MMTKKYMILVAAMVSLLTSCTETVEQSVRESYAVFTSTNGAPSQPKNGMRRTMMNPNGNFYWTEGDDLWLKDNGNFVKNASNNISSTQKEATFVFNGDFPEESYTVYYSNAMQTGRAQVKILQVQNQKGPNNANHFGACGDCGTAIATKQPDGTYSFKLNHHSTYLRIYPYLNDTLPDNDYRLNQIQISAKNSAGKDMNLGGVYTFDENGFTATTGGSPIALRCNHDGTNAFAGFTLTKDPDTALENTGCYVVMAPGEYELTIRYHIINMDNTRSYTVSRDVSLRTFEGGKYNDIRHKLGFEQAGGGYAFSVGTYGAYYEWGATKWYWDGYEQICPEYPVAYNADLGWPEYAPRSGQERYHLSGERYEYPAGVWHYPAWETTNGGQKYLVAPSYRDLHRLVKYGDPHWDITTPWEIRHANGSGSQIVTGGMWFLRKPYASESKNYQEYDVLPGNLVKACGCTATSGRPAKEDLDKYFFLPCLGSYYDGKLVDRSYHGADGRSGVGKGVYWCGETYVERDADGGYRNWFSNKAYHLIFNGIEVELAPANTLENGAVLKSMPIESL